jgi:chorismate dehydratase
LRCLLAEFELTPRLVCGPLGSAGCQTAVGGSSPATHRAQLLIGDQAIGFRESHEGEFQFWDLGEQWKKLIGLPFVYALWLIRPEVADPKSIASRLRALRNENLANLDELIAGAVAGVADPGSSKQLDSDFLGHYYHEHLRFSFGEEEKKSLRTFANLCAKHGLLEKCDLRFDVV